MYDGRMAIYCTKSPLVRGVRGVRGYGGYGGYGGTGGTGGYGGTGGTGGTGGGSTGGQVKKSRKIKVSDFGRKRVKMTEKVSPTTGKPFFLAPKCPEGAFLENYIENFRIFFNFLGQKIEILENFREIWAKYPLIHPEIQKKIKKIKKLKNFAIFSKN